MKIDLIKSAGIATGLVLVAGVILVLSFVPWALWNKFLVPTFGFPPATFWQVFFVCVSVNVARTLLFGVRGSKSKD